MMFRVHFADGKEHGNHGSTDPIGHGPASAWPDGKGGVQVTATVDNAFHLADIEQLRTEIRRLDLRLPAVDDTAALFQPLAIGDRHLANRFCVQPMEGADALPDGAPGRLTYRRYERYARGGFALIWVEATAVREDGRSNPRQLFLRECTVEQFAEFTAAVRKAAIEEFDREVLLVLQLTHSGRHSAPDGVPLPVIAHHCPELDRVYGVPAGFPLVADDELDRLKDAYAVSARLALEAGFDGVDIKCCHGNLLAELHAAHTRPGRYGGSFENRTRLLRDILALARGRAPGLLLAVRLSACDGLAHPYGFGVRGGGGVSPDLEEPVRLAKLLRREGASILNVSLGTPGVNPYADEHPLVSLDRSVRLSGAIQEAVPDLPVVSGAYSWLRQFIPNVAAGVIAEGGSAIAGLGRAALAYPDTPKDILATGRVTPEDCCVLCTACIQLLRDGGTAGCVVRDSGVYGPEYRNRRRFAQDHLVQEARRCHSCVPAPCSIACPAHIDVPGFIRAFASGDMDEAFQIIRRSNLLPEMCSHLCPVWMQCEGACVETTFTGKAVPIQDIQYVVCWAARQQGLTALRLPAERTGRRVAVVGGGVAGVACATALLEAGHKVIIVERDLSLGGTPDSVIRAARFPGGHAEIAAMLRPALDTGALEVRHGQALGDGIALRDLREEYDAVLLATGLWAEQSPGGGEGVVDALTFLREAKGGAIASVPARVAVLGGGDCAMDAAALVCELGVVDLYIVYAGSFADMHWHMPEGWFANSGAHAMMLTEPLGYEWDEAGGLAGVRVCRTELGDPGVAGLRRPVRVEGGESLLRVDMVIEAMGLGVTAGLRDALKDIAFTEEGLVQTTGMGSYATSLPRVFAAGGLVNGGASVAECVAEGMQAAKEIDTFLSGSAVEG